MTYNDLEQSVRDGEPVELFRFYTSADDWLFTSANIPIEYDLRTYEPAYLKRSKIEQDIEKTKNEVKVTVRRNNAFAQLFIPAAPEVPVYFELYRGHTTFFQKYWVGSVLSVTFNTDEAEIVIGPPFRGGRMSGLRRKFQKQCTYPLYKTQCNVGTVPFALNGVVTAINGKIITVPAASAKPNGWFSAGKFKSGVTERLIQVHSGSSLTLSQGINQVSVNDACALLAGCDHTYGVCGSKFDNKTNYGGQPWIPSRNPFGGDGVT